MLPATREFFPKKGQGLRATCRVCFNLGLRKKPKRFDLDASTRTCSVCGETFPATAEHFAPHQKSPDGFSSHCRACIAERARARYKANPEIFIERERQYYLNNQARVDDYRKRWRAEHPELMRELANKWHRDNPWQSRAHKCNSRAKRQGVEGRVTGQELEKIFKAQEGKCCYCGKSLDGDMQVDHKEALVIGGPNVAANIAFSCAFCNNSKRALTPEQFADRKAKQGVSA